MRVSGIWDIVIVTGGKTRETWRGCSMENSSVSRASITPTRKNEGGIADALARAEHFADGRELRVGDNIIEAGIWFGCREFRAAAERRPDSAEASPGRRSVRVAEIAGNHIVSFDGRPKHPESSYAVPDVDVYDPMVFDMIRILPVLPAAGVDRV
jgi:glucose-1-phosphate thymidylyltransferase